MMDAQYKCLLDCRYNYTCKLLSVLPLSRFRWPLIRKGDNWTQWKLVPYASLFFCSLKYASAKVYILYAHCIWTWVDVIVSRAVSLYLYISMCVPSAASFFPFINGTGFSFHFRLSSFFAPAMYAFGHSWDLIFCIAWWVWAGLQTFNAVPFYMYCLVGRPLTPFCKVLHEA